MPNDTDHLVEKSGSGECTGVSHPCGKPAHWRRQHTAYADDNSNWVMLCDECHIENEANWDDMWRDYYGGLL